MMKRMLAVLLVLMMAVSLMACGEEEVTTLTGMVLSVEGTTVSLKEMDISSMGEGMGKGQRPPMPEGMEGFQNFGDFNPEDFEGQMPQRGEGEMPQFPEGQMPSRPENGERPERPTGEDGEMFTFPTDENGKMQWPSMGENGGMRPDISGMEGETTQIDIGSAHISVEIDGGKASGTLEDILPGCFVTITKNADGEVTNVLVSAGMSGFGGMGGKGGFGGFGNFEGFQDMDSNPQEEDNT